jgi:iron complex outermembrane receptor protein
MSHISRWSGVLGCILLSVACAPHGWSQDHATSSDAATTDLSQLTLEDLTKVQVSSVERKEQDLMSVPAAVFVITQQDIRRAGVTSLPELFRMVPGMQVAQVYANEWAVSARGFNSRFADKMLVLIDGRSIYSEIYSGVFWDQNDLLLEDIDHIEVIRGPGGTLWGANAVNGIINIITLKAKRTQGVTVEGEDGRIAETATLRYGGEAGTKVQYRGFVKYLRRNDLLAEDGSAAQDSGNAVRGGGRLDWQARQHDWLTFHGNLYTGKENQRVFVTAPDGTLTTGPDTVDIDGGFALARWEHQLRASQFALQAYFNHDKHAEHAGSGVEKVMDIEFQDRLPSLARNDLNWGVGYRLTIDHVAGNPNPFLHSSHRDALYNIFAEDDLTLIPGRLKLTLGMKLLHNTYTGWELQPGGRMIWTPNDRHSLWGAVSRAVRTPSVQDRDLNFYEPTSPIEGLPAEVLAMGNPAFASEQLLSFEVGYRQRLGRTLSLDLATFYNRYTDLRSQTVQTPGLAFLPGPTLVIPILYTNQLKASANGVEAAVSWNPRKALQVQTSYSWSNGRLRLPGNAAVMRPDSWSSPTNTLSVRSTWAFTRNWSLISMIYGVSRLERPEQTTLAPVVGYVRLDTHVAFKLGKVLQLTAGGDNLLQGQHPEFDPQDAYSVRSQIPRSEFVRAVWSF